MHVYQNNCNYNICCNSLCPWYMTYTPRCTYLLSNIYHVSYVKTIHVSKQCSHFLQLYESSFHDRQMLLWFAYRSTKQLKWQWLTKTLLPFTLWWVSETFWCISPDHFSWSLTCRFHAEFISHRFPCYLDLYISKANEVANQQHSVGWHRPVEDSEEIPCEVHFVFILQSLVTVMRWHLFKTFC